MTCGKTHYVLGMQQALRTIRTKSRVRRSGANSVVCEKPTVLR